MEILKSPLSPIQCCEPIKWLGESFFSLLFNIVKRGRGKGAETRNFPKGSFSHNFCHWLSEKIWKSLSVAFWYFSFRITWKACDYLLLHYDTNLNNFWAKTNSLNIWESETKSLFLRFFAAKTKLWALQRRLH